jgi:glucosamine-6-phosphate deaminase
MDASKPIRSLRKDALAVEVYDSGDAMGVAASRLVAGELAATIQSKGSANLILATGASQFAFLANLVKDPSIDWSRMTVFHLDEYKGLSDRHPASFRRYLRQRILDQVRPAEIHFLQGDAVDGDAEAARYAEILRTHQVDVACIGIGENGHIAFNDPSVADFEDDRLVKVVELDPSCRRQQLGEGWFLNLDEVPTHALTLTVPAIMASRMISCVVPDLRKAEAVQHALEGPVSTACPASILRTHPNARLFLDRNSASALTGQQI